MTQQIGTPALDLRCVKCGENEAIEISYGSGGAVIYVLCRICRHHSFFQRRGEATDAVACGH